MSGGGQEREALLQKHRGLVVSIVTRFLGRGESREDLEQVASLALLEADARFEPARGLAFSTYAYPVIEGRLREHLRRGGTVTLSRALRRNTALLARARETLGEEASIPALSEHTGLSKEEVALALGAMQTPRSLSELAEHQTPAHEESGYEAVLTRHTVAQALGLLSRRDRALISLRYLRGLSQSETARVLGVTQSTVSRAESRILRTLRARLAP